MRIPLRWTLRLLASATVGLVPVATLPVAAAATTAPPPKPPASLPSGIEDLTSYVPQTACDPTARTGTDALARLLTSTYQDTTANTTYACGTDGPVSEHYDGRAIDWMISARTAQQQAEVQAFLTWLVAPDAAGHPYAMARRLGVMYVIYDAQIWGAYRASEGWRPYACSGVTGCHQDHVHISLSWNGALGRTSFWTGTVAPGVDYGPCRPADLNWAPPYTTARASACPSYPAAVAPAGATAALANLYAYSGAQVQQGSTGPAVAAVQAAVGASADGDFGPLTKSAVVSYQTAHQLPGSGVVDATTWRALLAAATPAPTPAATPAPTAAPTPAPVPAASTGTTVTPPSASAPTPAPTPTSTPTSTPRPTVTANPLARYETTVLRQGATGPAVAALQRALRIGADGQFGPLTRAAVVRFQQVHVLPATGVVTLPTWVALGAPAPHPTSPVARYVRLVVRRGATGAAVVALQRKVGTTADGSFGPHTQAAVTAWQRAHRLPATGVVSTDTWLAFGA